MTVEIIAEAGCNHNGLLAIAMSMADFAKRAGADTFKTQTSVPEEECAVSAPNAAYMGAGSQLDLIREIILPFDKTALLAQHCEDIGIRFLSTPADPVSLKFLVEECGVNRIKLGSDNLTNPVMIEAAAKTGLPLILSTGMATLEEVYTTLALIRGIGKTKSLTLMHCTSCYPTRAEDANVGAVASMAMELSVPVGFSDHTQGSTAAIVAVGAGAKIIEKHFTLDREMTGPDHKISAGQTEFIGYVRCVRAAERYLGSGSKVPCSAELEVAQAVRKSVVAACDIAEGDWLTDKNLAIKRPATGRRPWDIYRLRGTVATRSYQKDEMIE